MRKKCKCPSNSVWDLRHHVCQATLSESSKVLICTKKIWVIWCQGLSLVWFFASSQDFHALAANHNFRPTGHNTSKMRRRLFHKVASNCKSRRSASMKQLHAHLLSSQVYKPLSTDARLWSCVKVHRSFIFVLSVKNYWKGSCLFRCCYFDFNPRMDCYLALGLISKYQTFAATLEKAFLRCFQVFWDLVDCGDYFPRAAPFKVHQRHQLGKPIHIVHCTALPTGVYNNQPPL